MTSDDPERCVVRAVLPRRPGDDDSGYGIGLIHDVTCGDSAGLWADVDGLPESRGAMVTSAG